MTTAIETLTQLMTTTQEENEQYLKEVISEIKIKRKVGRPVKFTAEEILERKRASYRRRYHLDPAKKIARTMESRRKRQEKVL